MLTLTVEHRSAPAPAPFTIELATDHAPHLRVVDDPAPQATQPNLNQAILAALSEAGGPLVGRDDFDHALDRMHSRGAPAPHGATEAYQ